MSSPEAAERYPYPNETPEGIEGQRRALHNLGLLLLESHADVNDDALRTTEVWRSGTATTAVADVRVLATSMRTDSDAIAPASTTMTTYIGRIEHARDRIDLIRDRYDQAVEDRATANADPPDWAKGGLRQEYRDANQFAFEQTLAQIQTDYDDVLADLKTDSTPAVTALHQALEVLAPAAQRHLGTLDQVAYGDASTSLDLTGNLYELTLREAGLLTGATPPGAYTQWLENAERRGLSPDTILQIASDHDLTPEDFELLDGLQEVQDTDGKSFYLLPDGISGEDARKAVLLTYILNAGTDYGTASDDNDFEETPYSSQEVQRIIDRQAANDWTYADDVGFVHGNGGVLATTPNGMIMGLGGNWLQDIYSQQGGTTYGDIFMLNIDDVDDSEAALIAAIESGKATYEGDDGIYQGDLDLDRLLHHEERHSQQWAREGYFGFLSSYAWEQLTRGNETEEDAGLSDGGYG